MHKIGFGLVTAMGVAVWCCNNGLPTTTPDASGDAFPINDATNDGPVPMDAGPTDAASDVSEAGPTTLYNDITNTSDWESFDIFAWGPVAYGFRGGAFDGRYIYYVPSDYSNGVLVRYDTTMSFTSSSSWSKFDMTNVNANMNGYAGAVFGNGILYLIPSTTTLAGRYDTTASLTDAGSYQGFNLSPITSNPQSLFFIGAAYDGRYVYPSPAGMNGFTATRYDTTAPFASAGSWSQVIVNTSSYGASTVGAVFDGKYVYYPAADNDQFRRFDTTKAFTDTGAWEQTAPESGFAYGGGAFDGRYVYFTPHRANINGQSLLPSMRYDTQGPFTSASSWKSYYIGASSTQYNFYLGAVFDGRYVFFIPESNTPGAPLLERYDTTSNAYADAGSPGFDSLDLSTVNAGANAMYAGGAFDGQYLYLVPSVGKALRFKAKSPASMPATYHGSFL